MEITTGHPRPLGATATPGGVDFAVESGIAERVEVCIFGDDGETRLELPTRIGDVFCGRVTGIGPGTEYGFRVHGPWDPTIGHRCNPAKLLLDPYARRMSGSVTDGRLLVGHTPRNRTRRDTRDSAPATMRSVVVSPEFDWAGDRPLHRPTGDTVIYETHVKGLSATHPDVPEGLRGTYAGLGHEAVLAHLVGLGVTAVELLPVHQFVHDGFLRAAGRSNYWGYNSIGFFAPHHQYAAASDPVAEFKEMVRNLHGAGLEVILDVVYNHTAEGNHLGPTLSFRGLDNRAWYRLDPTDRSKYLNWAGTGNVLDFGSSPPLCLAMDSLRYWVEEMHVDGFRFDLATVLGRTHADFDPLGAFFGAVRQDPVLRGTKFIAEPWDVGPFGYRVGQFPPGWSEWNDRYRDTVRDFWRSTDGTLGAFAEAVTGSSDLYELSGRKPTASINLVTSHDGFTLSDLVSYDDRHNAPNGEHGRDGHEDNRSWNSGVEGPTDDPDVVELRSRRRRAVLTTLLLSQGVPMLLGGDEIGRTQRGNNNAYNQDNPISWYDWASVDHEMLAFTTRLIGLRRTHPTFRRSAWLHEHADPSHDLVGWFDVDGREMTTSAWEDPEARHVALHLSGRVVHCESGTVTDDDVLLLFNGGGEPVRFLIPASAGSGWTVAVDSTEPDRSDPVGEAIDVGAYGLTVLLRPAVTPTR